jgi:hypothetical protein
MTGETKAELLARNRRDCEAEVAELERQTSGALLTEPRIGDW